MGALLNVQLLLALATSLSSQLPAQHQNECPGSYCSTAKDCPGGRAAEGGSGSCPDGATLCCRAGPPNGTQLLGSWSGWSKPPENSAWALPPRGPAPAKPAPAPGGSGPLLLAASQDPVFKSSVAVPISEEKARQIATEKCKFCSKYVFKEQTVSLLPGSKPIKRPFCGTSDQPLIIGGENAKPMEFPHMARIGYGDLAKVDWSCGGSLISERFILSAAHCSTWDGRPARWANLGDLDTTTETDNASPVTLRISEIYKHPDFNSSVNWYNDIALFKLAEDAPLGIYVRPACLNLNRQPRSQMAIISGWGLTKTWTALNYEFFEKPKPTKILQKAEFHLIGHAKCNDAYSSLPKKQKENFADGIRKEMICAGGVSGKSVCSGDSGGPLQVVTEGVYCMYDIVGVTSFSSGCKSEYPGVYTNVVEYLPWIVGTVWPNN